MDSPYPNPQQYPQTSLPKLVYRIEVTFAVSES